MSHRFLKIIFISIVTLGLVSFFYYRFLVPLSDVSKTENINVPPIYEANIVVLSPTVNEIVGTDFTITGRARVFESQFAIRVSGGNKKLYEASVYSNASDVGQYGDFIQEIHLPVLSLGAISDITLEAFQYSPKDGSEIDKVIVPLKFKK